MKKTVLLYSFFFLFCISPSLFAQPANDQACNALEISLDAPPISISNIGASVQAGEEVLTLPGSSDCAFGTWCDSSGPMATPGIDHSLWFKFTTPSNEQPGFHINLCNSTFNTQLALYSYSDCADFGTYELIWLNDNQISCGSGEDASTLEITCLDYDREYLVLVDDWQSMPGQAVDSGEVIIEIQTFIYDFPGPEEAGTVTRPPSCPGGSDGAIDVSLISGVHPIRYEWSNGASTQDISGLTAGSYSVTITDFCDLSVVSTYELADPTLPLPEIVFAYQPMEVIHPINCGSNAQGGQINPFPQEGVAPYSYLWSTGETTASISDLADGSYTVTVTDFCGNQTAEKTYYVGMTAGPDITADCSLGAPQIGLDHSLAGVETARYTCQTDSVLYPAGACRTGNAIGRSAHWKSFDLINDYGLSTEINLIGVEVYLQSIPNTAVSSTIPIKAVVYLASTPLLNDSTLQLIALDSLEIDIPPIPEFRPFFLPLKGIDLGAFDIFAVKIETLTDSSDGHIFGIGASSVPANRPTYYTSEDCGVARITAMPDLGFDDYLAMSVLLNTNSPSGLFYQWDGPVSDPFSATPLAEGSGTTTYSVTITDAACGITVVDEVTVVCTPNGTQNQETFSFSLFPNPSDGIFQIKHKGAGREVQIALYDLQGRLLRQEQRRLGNGATAAMDVSTLPQGLYFIHLATEAGTELHRLVLH